MNTQSMLPGSRSVADARARPVGIFERALAATMAVACIGLLVYKVVLTRLLNVNWDEFHFLSHVYALGRGELTLLMTGAYTHLFSWLRLLPGEEMQQILAARLVMTALLAVTAWLVWRLARVWMTGFPALVPPFVYLSAMPVLQHGGSFRFDSMLAPLTMASLALALAPGSNSRRDWLAGAMLGLAFAVTVKVVLFAPLFLVALLFRDEPIEGARDFDWRAAASAVIRVSTGAAVTAAALIGLHWLTITPTESDSVVSFATGAARKTLLDTPWFPRIAIFERFVRWQPLPWFLIALGSMIALLRRRMVIASLVLALLPLAFYRNAFPYYYVVMLAPACILAGYAVQEMVTLVRAHGSVATASALLGTLWIGLFYQGLAYTWRLSIDDQTHQRTVVSAVHQVFPEPVNYVDRCAMISSFRQVNFFMSTWGMDNYRKRNEPFMPAAIRDRRPAFVLVNGWALNPNRRYEGGLLPDDYDLIARFYPKYWGPLRVAGATVEVSGTESVRLMVPFPAEYRIAATGPILVDEVPRRHGDVVRVPVEGVTVRAFGPHESAAGTRVTLFLATAQPPPPQPPPDLPLFAGL